MAKILSEREKERRLQIQKKHAALMSNEMLAEHLSSMAERAQRYTSFERIALLNEAANRLSLL